MKKNAIYEIPRDVHCELYEYQEKMVDESICLLNMLGIKVCIENLNPASNNTIDCQVRALAKVLNIGWMEAYDKLIEQSKKYYTLPDHTSVLSELLKEYGFEEVEDFQCSVATFMHENIHGTYVIFCKGHVFVYSEGIWYDTAENLQYIGAIFDISDNDTIYKRV